MADRPSASASTSPFATAPFNPCTEASSLLREQALLAGARWIESPNRDARPDGSTIDLLVIHNISLPPRSFGGTGVVELFTNMLDPDAHPYYATLASLRVSAHLFIRRSGAAIQFVRCSDRAWHAGVSTWNGRERCNDFSVGVELEGTDDMPFTYAQYARLIGVAHLLRQVYGTGHVAGHSDIAPDRKTDPGLYFDWRLFSAATGVKRLG